MAPNRLHRQEAFPTTPAQAQDTQHPNSPLAPHHTKQHKQTNAPANNDTHATHNQKQQPPQLPYTVGGNHSNLAPTPVLIAPNQQAYAHAHHYAQEHNRRIAHNLSPQPLLGATQPLLAPVAPLPQHLRQAQQPHFAPPPRSSHYTTAVPLATAAATTAAEASSERHSTRWVVEPETVELLEHVFAVVRCPSRPLCLRLARLLDVKPRQVQVWFQNKRQRTKNLVSAPAAPMSHEEQQRAADEVLALLAHKRRGGGHPGAPPPYHRAPPAYPVQWYDRHYAASSSQPHDQPDQSGLLCLLSASELAMHALNTASSAAPEAPLTSSSSASDAMAPRLATEDSTGSCASQASEGAPQPAEVGALACDLTTSETFTDDQPVASTTESGTWKIPE